MISLILKNNKINFIFIIFFSFFVNFYYASLGSSPMDSFAFFDTGYNILLGRHPFKDVWITTGPFVDYLQAFFFQIIGSNWNSYIIHSSILNTIVSITLFLFLINSKMNSYLALFFSSCFALLCYPVSGTPFAYLHSYVISLISILLFFNFLIFKSNNSLFILPFSMAFSFLSMQNPSTYINLIIISFLIYYFFDKENFKKFKYFFLGSVILIFLLLIFFLITEIPFNKFFQQYIQFPLSIGGNRLVGNEIAHISFSERFTFRNVLGHFKFIHLFLIAIIFFTFLSLRKKNISKEFKILIYSIIILNLSLIFNQLITSNQTYIFSIIPFTAAFLYIFLYKNFFNLKKIRILILPILLMITIKYHLEYNENRKFMDLKGIDLSKSVDASILSPKLKGLKWITYHYKNNPNKEIILLKEAIDNIKKQKNNKMVMSHYQFFSLILDENLFIPNRWYSDDNNSYPLEDHKYFHWYKKHFNQVILKNNIKVIYMIGTPIIESKNFYPDNICIKKEIINEITVKFYLRKCV